MPLTGEPWAVRCSRSSHNFLQAFPWRGASVVDRFPAAFHILWREDPMRRKMFGGHFRSYSAHLEALEKRKLLSAGIGSFVPGSGTWSLRSTASAGPADVGTFQFGANLPRVGDRNGDGRDDIGTFNAATATWSL